VIIPKLPPSIWGAARWCTCVSPPPHRSNTIGNQPSAITGWPSAPQSWDGSASQITVLDQDLGISGSGVAERSGFTHLTAEVALGRVGIVLGLEVSCLARNNADWYRLLDLCGTTDTLIGDADGIYHPGFNDRLVLGLKGTISEAELHVETTY
jgi:DNA invertase Pin-like site-specific DNA recombinase